MEAKSRYKISFFGLSDSERQVINSVISLSSSRSLSYTIVELHSDTADVILIDADDPQAVNDWSDSAYSASSYPKMLISKDTTLQNSKVPYLFRPLKAAKLLEELDKVVIKSLRGSGGGEDGLKVRRRREEVVRNQAGLVVGSDYRALLVDEDMVNRRRLEGLLETVGVKLDFVETGSEAIDIVKNRHLDMVFINADLPDMTGYQVCKFIKSNEALLDVPVIIVRAKAKALDLVRNTISGNDGQLNKPIEKELLYSFLKKYLSERRSRR